MSRTSRGTDASAPGSTGSTCDSCGAPEDHLVEVHRLYVTPESWDTEGSTQRVEATEMWCFPCRTHYPHEAVE